MNFKHLYYFWMVARIGGVVRASHRLHITPQTMSGQIKLLEDRLGGALFERDGRNIRLTEAGRIAATYADDIFTKGLQLEAAVRESFEAQRESEAARAERSVRALRPGERVRGDAAVRDRPQAHLALVAQRD